MSGRRKICFVSGTRADYGIMSRLIRRLKDDPGADVQLIVTNMHLSPLHGMTVSEIEADGVTPDARVAMIDPKEPDSPGAVIRAMGRELSGMAEALERLTPDIMVILGDRYEMLMAASAALVARVPVAHLYGGETTLGAIDNSIRHAITQLSALHFTATPEYRDKVISLGAAPETVKWVGSLGVDNIAATPLLPLEELEQSIGSPLGRGFITLTYHPATAMPGQSEEQTRDVIDALTPLLGDRRMLVTMPNSDCGAAGIRRLLNQWSERHPDRVVAVESLGRVRYYSALANTAAVVGNSSSALIEAPQFGIPTLNIGPRQQGRAAGPTVVSVEADRQSIADGLSRILDPAFMAQAKASGKPINPYYKPDTLEAIATTLLSYPI